LKIVTAEEMRGIEARCVQRSITLDSLMERAGESVAMCVRAHARDDRVLILVGPGNNGGDGLVAAASLEGSGHDVVVYTWNRTQMTALRGDTVRAEEDESGEELARLLGERAIVVDALLGIGQSRPVEGRLARIVDIANGRRADGAWALAVDIPTGVDADTGRELGSAFRADMTLCMGFGKLGAYLYPGAACAGELRVADVGIPAGLEDGLMTSLSDDREIALLLPERKPDANKGSSGRLLAVTGSRDFTGAPVLTSMAAYRAGAGLVEVATPASAQPVVAAHTLEPVYLPLAETDGKADRAALPELEKALEKARALLLGPGLGLSDGTVQLVRGVLDLLRGEGKRPAVLDADGLNALARIDGWFAGLRDVVITPHPGEMSRLTGQSIPAIQADRPATARKYASEWGVVVVLKGARTVIASPDGRLAVNPTGGPNLATAGTGDVLTGVIAGLLAQGANAWDAARAGVFLHGRAGDLARERLGNVGTVAGDLLDLLVPARQSVLNVREER
jgi:NAD(P)H-hydrate epimerase